MRTLPVIQRVVSDFVRLRGIFAAVLVTSLVFSSTLDAHELPSLDGERFLLRWLEPGESSQRVARVPSRTTASAGTRVLELPIDGRLVTVRLEPFSVRAASFRLLTSDAAGELSEVTPPPSTTYRGGIDELPGAVVAGAIDDAGLAATIALADGQIFCVEPWPAERPNHDVLAHRVYRAELDVEEGACPVEDAAQPVAAGPEPLNRTAALQFADIAVDADFEYVGMNGGSVTSTVNDIEALLNSVNVVFERDCDLRHRLVTLIVRSAEPDPYSSTDAVTLYSQLRTHWNNSQSGIERDVVHLMTGKELAGSTIGYAAVGEVCNRSRAYGLTQARFSTNLARRTALVAHELGHNWNAVHCDAASPCNIMCSSLGSCDFIGLPNFEPMGANAIRAFAATRSCLASPPVAVEGSRIPDGVQLAVTGPNPFTRRTRLEFFMPRPGFARLGIFDVEGRRVASIVDGVQAAGWHSRFWDGTDARGVRCRPGAFYARLETPTSARSRALILLR